MKRLSIIRGCCHRVTRRGSQSIKKCYSSSFIDITGNETKYGLSSSCNLLDEAMFNMISFESEPTSQLLDIVMNDPDCSIARSLLLFDMLNQGNSSITSLKNDIYTTESLLLYLEKQAELNRLDKREMHLASAALSWSENDYLTSAKLLEGFNQQASFDALQLKWAQLAYRKAGCVQDVFGCIARSSYSLNSKHHLYGHLQGLLRLQYIICTALYTKVGGQINNRINIISVYLFQKTLIYNIDIYFVLLGMLAVGHIDNNRIQDAEETASRAISITRGKDYSAKEAMLQVYQLTGRTSEIYSLIESNKAGGDGEGQYQKILLLYHEALCKIQRGNYGGAITSFHILIDHSDDFPNVYPIHSIIFSTMILWSLQLNSMHPNIAYLWQDPCYRRCWHRIDQHDHVDNDNNSFINNTTMDINNSNSSNNNIPYRKDVLFNICRVMYLHHQTFNLPPNDEYNNSSSNENTISDNLHTTGFNISNSKLWQWIRSTSLKHRQSKPKELIGVIDYEHMQLLLDDQLLNSLQSQSNNTSNNKTNTSTSTSNSAATAMNISEIDQYPYLRNFQQKFIHNNRYSHNSSSHMNHNHNATSANLCHVLSHSVYSFMKSDYQKSVDLLIQPLSLSSNLLSNHNVNATGSQSVLQQGNIDLLGWSNIEKELFSYHTLLEGLLRIENSSNSNNSSDDSNNSSDDNQMNASINIDNNNQLSGKHNQYINPNPNLTHQDSQSQKQFEMKESALPLNLDLAKRICCERILLRPNEAQTWRRLSSLFGQSCQYDLAGHAHHTAWQLGIGQGGFGGPT